MSNSQSHKQLKTMQKFPLKGILKTKNMKSGSSTKKLSFKKLPTSSHTHTEFSANINQRSSPMSIKNIQEYKIKKTQKALKICDKYYGNYTMKELLDFQNELDDEIEIFVTGFDEFLKILDENYPNFKNDLGENLWSRMGFNKITASTLKRLLKQYDHNENILSQLDDLYINMFRKYLSGYTKLSHEQRKLAKCIYRRKQPRRSSRVPRSSTYHYH